MDPWKPRLKPLYDFIDSMICAAELAAIWAAFVALVIITL